MRSLRKYNDLFKRQLACSCQQCAECSARRELATIQKKCSRLAKACFAFLYNRYYYLEEFQLVRKLILADDTQLVPAISADSECEGMGLAMALDLYGALDEADTAFAVLNLCDELTPQARKSLGEAWTKLQEVFGKIHGPESEYAQSAVENRKTLEAAFGNQ